jgi:hypothetical protein
VKAVDFLDDESWSGGFYELSLILGEVDDVDSYARLEQALRSCWSHPALTGPYLSRRQMSGEVDWSGDMIAPLYGWIDLPFGRTVVVTHVIREEHGSPNLDWFDVGIPLGGLSNLHPSVGGYPAEPIDRVAEWRPEVDVVLVSIAEAIYASSGFVHGLIGCEVSGEADSFVVPDERAMVMSLPPIRASCFILRRVGHGELTQASHWAGID